MGLFFQIFQGSHFEKCVCFCGKIPKNGYLFSENSLEMQAFIFKESERYHSSTLSLTAS